MAGRHARDYYEASAPSDGPQPQRTCPPRSWLDRNRRPPDGSHVRQAIDRSGRRPALLRQPRHAYAAALQRGLPTVGATRLRSRPPHTRWPCAAHRPLSARFEPASLLRSVKHWFTCITPSDLATRTRAVWQSRHVPPLSGPLAALPGVAPVGLPPGFTRPLRRPSGNGLSPLLDRLGASWHTAPGRKKPWRP